MVTLDEAGLRLTLKGHRKGQELRWEDFVSGEAALATALNASLAQANDAPAAAPPPARKKKRARKNPGARSR